MKFAVYSLDYFLCNNIFNFEWWWWWEYRSLSSIIFCLCFNRSRKKDSAPWDLESIFINKNNYLIWRWFFYFWSNFCISFIIIHIHILFLKRWCHLSSMFLIRRHSIHIVVIESLLKIIYKLWFLLFLNFLLHFFCWYDWFLI